MSGNDSVHLEVIERHLEAVKNQIWTIPRNFLDIATDQEPIARGKFGTVLQATVNKQGAISRYGKYTRTSYLSRFAICQSRFAEVILCCAEVEKAVFPHIFQGAEQVDVNSKCNSLIEARLKARLHLTQMECPIPWVLC